MDNSNKPIDLIIADTHEALLNILNEAKANLPVTVVSLIVTDIYRMVKTQEQLQVSKLRETESR